MSDSLPISHYYKCQLTEEKFEEEIYSKLSLVYLKALFISLPQYDKLILGLFYKKAKTTSNHFVGRRCH